LQYFTLQFRISNLLLINYFVTNLSLLCFINLALRYKTLLQCCTLLQWLRHIRYLHFVHYCTDLHSPTTYNAVNYISHTTRLTDISITASFVYFHWCFGSLSHCCYCFLLQHVRTLSRKQFMLRALLYKARKTAGLKEVAG